MIILSFGLFVILKENIYMYLILLKKRKHAHKTTKVLVTKAKAGDLSYCIIVCQEHVCPCI